MDVKELLRRHYEINQAIDSKLEQIEELKSLATKITVGVPREGHGSGGYSDRVGRTTAKIIDLENEINAEIDHLVDIKLEIRELVSLLPDATQRTLLERHYLLHESWERIAEKMGYTPRHVTRLHGQAIEALEAIYEHRSKQRCS